MKQILFVTSIMIMALMCVNIAQAQWTTDPAVNTHVCTAPSSLTVLGTISDGAGGTIIQGVWSWTGGFAGWPAQRMSALGYKLWGVNGTNTGWDWISDVAEDGNGGMLVLTGVGHEGNGETDVQRYGPQGGVLFNGRFGFNHEFEFSRSVNDGSGGAIAITQGYFPSGGSSLSGQRFNSSGVALWGVQGVQICSRSVSGMQNWRILKVPGGVFVAWRDSTLIYARFLSSNGTFYSEAAEIFSSAEQGGGEIVDLVSDGFGGAFVFWVGPQGPEYQVLLYVQHVDNSGNLPWGSESIQLAGQYITETPAYHAISDEAGGAIVCYSGWNLVDPWPTFSETDIHAMRIQSTGALLWEATVCSQSANQTLPAISPDGTGGAIIAWQDHRAGNADIYAQRIDANGIAKWEFGPYGIPVSNAVGDQRFPKIISNGYGGAIIAWEDFRDDPQGDIYSQFIDASGFLATGLLTNAGFEDRSLQPWRFFSNGSAWNGVGIGGDKSPSCYAIHIYTAGTNTQLYQSSLTLEPDTRYRLTFSAQGRHKMNIGLLKGVAPYSNYGLNWTVNLTSSGWQQFSTEFTTTGFSAIIDDARLRFSVGPYAAPDDDYLIDNVRLEKVASGSPVITSHPQDKSVWDTQSATFTVTAIGPSPLYYQWQKNETNIPGANDPTYTTPPVTWPGDDVSQFRCVVTNPYGTVYSNPATLTVLCCGGGNLVQNPGFDYTTEGWSLFTNGTGTLTRVSPGHNGGSGRVTISTAGTNVQLTHSGISLKPLTTYQFSFWARSSTGHNMSVYLQKQTSPYTNYGLNNWIVDLTTLWQKFTRTVTTTGFSSPVHDGRLRFWFAPYDAAGDQFFMDDVELIEAGPAKETTLLELPATFALNQNYPNPFNPVTVISYDLPVTTQVSLTVYDLLGKEITTLVNEIQDAGFRSVEFDASNLASGMYFYRLRAGDFSDTKKLMVVK